MKRSRASAYGAGRCSTQFKACRGRPLAKLVDGPDPVALGNGGAKFASGVRADCISPHPVIPQALQDFEARHRGRKTRHKAFVEADRARLGRNVSQISRFLRFANGQTSGRTLPVLPDLIFMDWGR